MILSCVVVGLIALSCFGYGCIWIKLLIPTKSYFWAEKCGVAFALGIGTIGWILFWPGIFGWLDQGLLWAVLVPGWLGVFTFGKDTVRVKVKKIDHITILLILLILICVCMDFIEALSPPIDADSLAYHYALPKQFLGDGQIIFVPVAVQGAVPLMFHLTYLLNLALSGELGLTIWSFVTQFIVCLALYGVSRRWLSRNLSLTLVLVFVTTPAVIYGGGSGQLEVRTALFMLIGAVAASDSVKDDRIRTIVLTGLMAGFLMGSKYFGLFAAVGLFSVVICQRRWYRAAIIFAVVASVSGLQWYGWNWWHTGTPIFPVDLPLFGSVNPAYWNQQVDYYFSRVFGGCWPANIKGLLTYPVGMTLGFVECSGHNRTGLGAFIWLLSPGILLGIWVSIFAKNWWNSRLFLVTMSGVVYTFLWFFVAIAQDARHLVPVYPLFLLAAIVLVRRGLSKRNSQVFLTTAAMFSIATGLFAYVITSRNYVPYVFSDETRSEYLSRNTGVYEVVEWVNLNLTSEDRIANSLRIINYFLDVPYLFISPHGQARLEIHPETDLNKFLEQIKKEGISHLLLSRSLGRRDPSLSTLGVMDEFILSENSQLEVSIEVLQYSSRALRLATPSTIDVYKVLLN